ncbi:MAG: 5'-methylthioadenosine/S-adenosylhomocysteine nucleosidase, partial [Devosia sp.]
MGDAETYAEDVGTMGSQILVLTALVEEHRALVELMTGSIAAATVSHEFQLALGSNTVQLVCLSNMGNVNSALQTAYLLSRLRPKFVILCGIAGGIKSGTQYSLGDVIVADQTVLYESSKIRKAPVFGYRTERRLSSFPAGAALLRAARHVRVDNWPELVMQRLRSDRDARDAPRIVFGPIASGEKVVADRSFLTPIVRSYPLLKGIEMEGGGVASAAHAAGYHCESIVIKSVCDWADHHKNDDYHTFSSYAAAAFVKALLSRLSEPQGGLQGIEAPRSDRNTSDASTSGLFIEFLNPESQRIYGLDTRLSDDERVRQATAVINASIMLCPSGTVFPVGTVLETPYFHRLLPSMLPLLEAGKIRLSMREETVDQFLAKRRVVYSELRAEYPALFEGPTPSFPPSAFIHKETHIGKRIAQVFRQGPNNLLDWRDLETVYQPQDIARIASIPEQLLVAGQPITWTSVKRSLEDSGISPTPELRKLLQLSYCNAYVSEYRLEYLRNVEFAPFDLLPLTAIRRYDYTSLKRILGAFGLWTTISTMSASRLLRFVASQAYSDFSHSYT